MIFDNIYKNTVTFSSNGNIEFDFLDNKSEMRYLLDIIIDQNIIINNVFSIGTYNNIGTVINNSNNILGIHLDSTRVTLILNGIHTVQLKIKQGIFSEMRNNVPLISNDTIPVGFSFNITKKIMTESDNSYYVDELYTPFYDDMLSYINSLLDDSEVVSDLYTSYSHDNVIYPKFAYTDKLIADNVDETGKNKNISELIQDASIPNALFIDSNIIKDKLGTTVQSSIDKADTSVQNIYINSKDTPENGVNLNLSDLVRTIKKDNVTYYNYATDPAGIGIIEYNDIDFQSKILNSNIMDGKDYFVSYLTGSEYGFEDIDQFFKKTNNIKLTQNTAETDGLLYSSAKFSSLLSNKIDEIVPITPVVDTLIKMKVNDQGQVYENEVMSRADLSVLLDNHYEKSNVKKVINTSRSTVFFM